MYSEVFQLHADFLKALAHPKRLEIIHLLRDQALCVSEIQAMLDLPQALLSQHLQVLRSSGALCYQRQGKRVVYQISQPKIVQASDLIREVLIDLHEADHLSHGLSFPMTDLLPIVYDPVCRMRLSPKTASFHYRFQDTDWYFCASGCLESFKANPTHFINQATKHHA